MMCDRVCHAQGRAPEHVRLRDCEKSPNRSGARSRAAMPLITTSVTRRMPHVRSNPIASDPPKRPVL